MTSLRRYLSSTPTSEPVAKYVGEQGDVIGLDRFGESAPTAALFKHFGITAEAVAARARQMVRPRRAVTARDSSLEPHMMLSSN